MPTNKELHQILTICAKVAIEQDKDNEYLTSRRKSILEKLEQFQPESFPEGIEKELTPLMLNQIGSDLDDNIYCETNIEVPYHDLAAAKERLVKEGIINP